MTRFEAWALHAANLLVGGTGIAWAVLRYGFESEDPYALANHPLEPLARHAHVLLAPLLVFACGLIWQAHVWPRVRGGFAQRRSSGLALASTCAPMIASGYLLQIAESDGWRAAWLWVHLASSALWITAYVLHLSTRRIQLTGASNSPGARGTVVP